MNLKIIIKKITGNCKLEYSDIKGAGLSWFLEIDFFGGTYNVKDEKFHRLLFEFSSNSKLHFLDAYKTFFKKALF